MSSTESQKKTGTQATPTVSFQGEPGAFSELAIRRAWPHGATPYPCETFDLALDRVIDRTVEFAMIPVENAIVGRVLTALSALDARAGKVREVMDLRVPVHLYLMALPGATLASLRAVRSHPVALAQCRYYLAQHPWLVPEPHFDTAGAARDVSRGNDLAVGAVASEAAATRYQLHILARNVEDVSANWTRFVIMERSA
jgi:prephenate dehydratase